MYTTSGLCGGSKKFDKLLPSHGEVRETREQDESTDEGHEETEFAILVVWRTTLAPVQRDTNNNSGIDTHMSKIE